MWLFYAAEVALGLCKYSGLFLYAALTVRRFWFYFRLCKYLGSFLYAALTAQSGGKAPRFDRADPRVWGYAPPYTPADNVERCVGKISLSAVRVRGERKVYPVGSQSLRASPRK